METFNVKNYTSAVPAARTAERIENFLARAGAQRIAKHYTAGRITGIDFVIDAAPGVAVSYRLPVDVAAVARYMLAQRSKSRSIISTAQRATLAAQAERTAWRLMQDWVESQLSLVATRQAEMAQVFLAYALDANSEETFYAHIKRHRFAQLAAPPTPSVLPNAGDLIPNE